MSDRPEKDDLNDMTVEPLSDGALEAVAGGTIDPDSSRGSGLCCSCNSCSAEPVAVPV